MTNKDKTKIRKVMELIMSVDDNEHKDKQFKRFIIEQIQFWVDDNEKDANKNKEVRGKADQDGRTV